ncbi:MAG: DUF3971 domain-containing protein [Hyphomicrobiales bacterium]
MRGRLTKWAVFGVTGFLVLGLCVFAAAAWRLSQGPVSLSYFNPQLREIISNGLGGNRAEISDLVIERDSISGATSLRMRDLKLYDESGALIAKAPRAAIGIDVSQLITGNIVPNRLELIGPAIKVRRLLTGEIKMGFGEADESFLPPALPQSREAKSAEGDPQPAGIIDNEDAGLTDFVRREFFSQDSSGGGTTITSIQISNASFSLYDQENDAIWSIPRANLAFKKVGFGASLFFDAQVASGPTPWKLDVVANYRRSTDNFGVVAKIADLIPADISRKIFMLSKLTQVKLPLSGQVDLELDRDLQIKSAKAQLAATAGEVDFPEFLSRPIEIEQGTLNLTWNPEQQTIILNDSTLTTRTALTALAAQFRPIWSQDGHLSQVDFALKARNSERDDVVEASPYLIDRIDATGSAKVEEGQVRVDDLLVMSGTSGVRLRGYFAEGDEAISMKVSGRLQNLPFRMAADLWPPIVAPKAREWMRENIRLGSFDDGTFKIDLPSSTLAAAIRDKKPIPDNLIDAQIEFSGATTSYFEGQPDIKNMAGKILIRGDSLDLTSLSGVITSDNGGVLKVIDGHMFVTELANPISKGDLEVRAKTDVGALLELADRPPLNMISNADFNANNASGTADMTLALKMPLKPKIAREDISISASIKLNNFGLKSAFRALDLSEGDLQADIDTTGLRATGKVKLDGIPAKLTWSRKTSPVNLQAFKLETTLDEKLRTKLGLDLSKFVKGPVGIKLEGSGEGANISQTRITADLAKAKLELSPIRWLYGPREGTKAIFDIDFSDAERAKISNLSLTGKDLEIKGSISLKNTGELLVAALPTVKLNRLNVMSINAKRSAQGVLTLDVKGKTFDARPMIAGLFAESTGRVAPAGDERTEIKASIDKVFAYRERHIDKVNAIATSEGDALTSMRLEGRFSDGSPMQLNIQPRADGSRDMVLQTGNGGAALRASNLYSKVQGGSLDFTANLGRPGEGTIRRGDLTIRDFTVANEQELAQFQQAQQQRTQGTGQQQQQAQPLKFDKLSLPFAVDQDFVRIGDAKVRGPSVGALAHGSIRKVDGKLSIGGTLIPAYGLNSAFSEVPLIGTIITGGKDEGVIGVTFGLSGTMRSPQVQINPVSAIAPGFLRKVFEFEGQGALGAEQKRAKRKRKEKSLEQER